MYRDNTKNQRRNLVFATLVVLCILAADFFLHGAIRRPVQSAGLTIWGGIHQAIGGIAESGFFSTRAHLTRENQDLKRQIIQMQAEVASARAKSALQNDLEDAARLAAERSGITAPIVSSPTASAYGTFYIGAGSADGIRIGSLVLSVEGFALGHVDDLGLHRSIVKELFAPGEGRKSVV